MTDQQLIEIRLRAESAAHNAGAAYWSKEYRDHLVTNALADLHKAAAALGMKLVPAEHEAAADAA